MPEPRLRSHDLMKTEEANDAAWEACKGALIGAAKWGAAAAAVGAVSYGWSPVYRRTTVQFKVYIQMSAMVLGSMINADGKLREYEHRVRMQRRWMREKARWERYEEEVDSENRK